MSTTYSKLKPRCADITGAVDQVYSFPEMIDLLCKAITAGHVAAIGMANINLNMMYITCPQVHTDLVGIPRKIMGYGSNEVGKYTTAVIDLYSMVYFVVVDNITNFSSGMVGFEIPMDFLVETSFSGKSVGAALMPNWIAF